MTRDFSSEPKVNWSLGDHYDWHYWASWRALFATAAIIGVICGLAALASESVVRDLFGMAFGQDLIFGPDLLALVLASCIVTPGLWVWIRVLKNARGRPGDRPVPRSRRTGFRRQLLDVSVFLCWMLSAMAVYFSIYYGANLMLPVESRGELTSVIAPIVLSMGLLHLHAGLRRFGAEPRHSDAIGA